MSFAIIETGGKQYKVSDSNILKVEILNFIKGNIGTYFSQLSWILPLLSNKTDKHIYL